MILTIISVSLLLLGIIMCIVGDKKWIDWLSLLGFIIGLIASITSFLCICAVIGSHCMVKANIEKSSMTYESLVKRYEIVNTQYEDVSKSEVVKDIYEWNKEVYSEKYYADNLWTSWFCSKKHADSLEYIEIED